MIAFDASVLFGAVERRGKVLIASRRTLDIPTSRLTTEACVTEAMHLAGRRSGWKGQSEIWTVLSAYQIEIVSFDWVLTKRLMERYRDVPMDFADATLVALCSEDRRARVASFDSDFLAYRRDDGTPIPLVDDRLLSWD